VNPQVEAKFTGPVDGCAPFDARFQTQSIGSISFYGWDFGDGSPSDSRPTPQHQFNSSPTHSDVMTYTVTHTVRNSFCTDVVSQPFTLYPQPAANFVVDKTSGCQPLEVTFTNTSNNGPYPNPSTGMTYIYDYRDGRADSLYTTDPVKHSFINTLGQNLPVSPVMTAMNQWGCTNNFSQSLTIFPFVKADFIMDYPDDGCSPLVVNFRNGSQGYATYQYTFGDGTQKDGTRTDGIHYSHTYINPSMYIDATYNVTLSVEAGGTGCRDAVTRQVTALAKPTADFRPGPPYPGDYIHPVTSIQIDNLIQPDITRESLKYLWSWSEQGSGYINNFSSSVYPSPLMIPDWGYFDITQRVTAPNDICSDSKTTTIHIVPPAAQADFKDVPPDCMPYEVRFENTSRNADAYVWKFGDDHGSNLKNPTHVYADAGPYTVTLTATGDNPFPSTKTKIIVVHPTPQAFFEVSPKFLWVGKALRAFNQTTHEDSNGLPYDVWYRWDWGDNTPNDTVENPSHMYMKAGTYQITLIAGTYTDPQCVSKYVKSDAVDLENAGDIILPNIFKPLTSGEPSDVIQEGGYRNYLFYPPVLSPVRKYHFVIYSRVGQLLFETKDPGRGWNGYYKGRLCDEGVYTYKVEGVYETGQAFQKMGDVTILR
jgi:PKD repeat protein